MDENKCPVCGNKEGFIIRLTSEWASLIAYEIGSVSLIACSECGCVYASVQDRKERKKLQEERKRGRG